MIIRLQDALNVGGPALVVLLPLDFGSFGISLNWAWKKAS